MALTPSLVQFFIERINSATISTIKGACSQLFEHLTSEIKDNPVFDSYEKDFVKWENWPDGFESSFSSSEWEIPGSFLDAKTLSYSLYKRVSRAADPFHLLYNITQEGGFDNQIFEFNKAFLNYFTQALNDIINANPEINDGKPEKVTGTKVFIIHGHDELLKKDLQLLLHRAGVTNIVLHEQPDKGRSIIDKLIEESIDSNYAIGILTPDDVNGDGQMRARQNVILEIGYFLGRLGKERVRMLVKEDIEIPSDLQGVLYQKFDAGGAWKIKILKELIAVGVYADLRSVTENF